MPASASAPAPAGPVEITEAGPVERVGATHLRKVIAQAMSLSAQTSVHVPHVDEADVTDLVAAYRRMKAHVEKDGTTKFSLMPIFIKAAVTVLKDHPLFNASYDEAAGQLVYKRYYHIGVAVDTEAGLIVPVIRSASKLSLKELSEEARRLAAACLDGSVSPDDLSGGTFTVTNLGSLGIESFTPVLNVPQVAILGVGNINLKPVELDGQVRFIPHLSLSLTINHQVVDGAPGARFLQALTRNLAELGLLLAL